MRAKYSEEPGLRFRIPRAEKSGRWREHFFTFYSLTGGGAIRFPAHTRVRVQRSAGIAGGAGGSESIPGKTDSPRAFKSRGYRSNVKYGQAFKEQNRVSHQCSSLSLPIPFLPSALGNIRQLGI